MCAQIRLTTSKDSDYSRQASQKFTKRASIKFSSQALACLVWSIYFPEMSGRCLASVVMTAALWLLQ
jgi:hypothetical protein